jgi:hypothetical protein
MGRALRETHHLRKLQLTGIAFRSTHPTPARPFVIAGLDPAIHGLGEMLFVKIDGYAGQARV